MKQPGNAHDEALAARFAGRFCVVFAGNISPAQDLGLLVACAQRLRRENRRDIHFVIVGDGMSREALQAQIEREGLGEWFSFEGQRPARDIPRYTGVAGALFAVPFAPWLRARAEKSRLAPVWSVGLSVGLLALLVVCSSFLIKQTYNPFIYFQF